MLRRSLILAAVLSAATAGMPAPVTEPRPRVHHMVRTYDWASGFPWSYAAGLEQDRRGFLWVDTTSGLYRFDGTRSLRAAGSMGVAPGGTAAGRVIVYSPEETLEATPEGLKRLDRDGAGCPSGLVVAVATDGTPWRVCNHRVERLGSDGAWTAIDVGTSDDRPWLVRPGRNGRVFAASQSRVWSVEAGGVVRASADIEHALVLVERENGVIVVGANQAPGPVTTRIFEVAAGSTRLVYEERGARLLSIAERGDTIWIATDQGLQALGPGYVPTSRLTSPTVEACGHIVVDREGSLWMATSRGLIQLPEPDLYAIAPEGVGVTRDIARTEKGIWGTFWGRLGFLRDAPGPPRWIDAGVHFTTLCRDGAGRVWTAGVHGVTSLTAGGAIGSGFGGSWEPQSCGVGSSGRRWIVSGGQDLFVVEPKETHPHAVRVDVAGTEGMTFAAEGRDGTLWLSTGSRMCAAPAADLAAGRAVDWRCESLPGRDVIDLETMPSGDLWALVWAPNSIRRRAGGRWETVPGAQRLGLSWVNAISPSPSGGVWLVGQGIVMRVAERVDLPEGWEILEQPTAWNGLVSLNVSSIHEDEDGTLWLGTDVGIERITPAIRRRRADPPPVEIVSGSVNGVPVDPARAVELPYPKNRLDMHFAALTFRDPSAVRYRMRVHDDDPWSAPGSDGHFNFVDLPPGRYDLAVAASLDGMRWSPAAARLAFRVARPWYANPWLIGGSVIGLALAGHVSYRLRVKQRLARESQRTRIAMDLHDEVGSGLGAIAVLAGIAARPELEETRRTDALARIGSVSLDLARSLGDIVWSLRTSSGFLDAFWDQLVERSRPLFSSETGRLVLEAPDPVPHEPLSLVVRRNLHLVAYEALHNARRHSGAAVVALRLVGDGSSWRLEIEDDGRGLADGPDRSRTRRGLGLQAMKTRTSEMGGAITWDKGALGGTRVTISFRTGEG